MANMHNTLVQIGRVVLEIHCCRYTVCPWTDKHTPRSLSIRYDTIRDAILTCARKPTPVSLIYRTETTTKNCKKRKKLQSKNGYARSNSKRLGNHVVSPGEEIERLQLEGFTEKEGFLE